MKGDYSDILKRIPEEPKWYDMNGAPRYDDPRPSLSPYVYADKIAFILVKCQECEREFTVEVSWTELKPDSGKPMNAIITSYLQYGDPPRHGGCVGETMNSIPIKVLQFWELDQRGEWRLNEKLSGFNIT